MLYSLSRKLKIGCSKNSPDIKALVNKLYPDFVFNTFSNTIKNEIPVFTFHSVEMEEFEAQLKYLARNNYQTITADMLYKFIAESEPIPERSIALTFDDARSSVWSVAYPLLKRYDLRAICFVVPACILEDANYHPNLDDFWQGKVPFSEIENRESNQNKFCTWGELKIMHESKIIDFQAHTMHHALIFTSPKIVDFINPIFDIYSYIFDIPVTRVNGKDDYYRKKVMGAPVYTHISRMSAKRRYFDDECLRNECISYVENNGEEKFFKKASWRKKLYKLALAHRKKSALNGGYETLDEQKASIYNELYDSKLTLERELNGKVVRHFAYPWFKGSDLSVGLSKKAGYLSNFWGISKARTTNQPGDDPYRIVRIPHGDYIYRLPGKGRKSLVSILKQRFQKEARQLIKNITV